jgi:hypothetical protein
MSEYFYCGADLRRDEWPYTCHRHIRHDGPCGSDRNEAAKEARLVAQRHDLDPDHTKEKTDDEE